MEFEWDKAKAAANIKKHKVTFDEASTVFSDPLARIVEDEEHSGEERREIIIGHSIINRLLLVYFTERLKILFEFSARDRRPDKSVRTMKKTQTSKRQKSDELKSEYRFDYSKSKPNRFASRVRQQRTVVVLDPDIAEVFTTPESVNNILRALIAAMPQNQRRKLSSK